MSEDMLRKVLVRELPGLVRDFMKKVLGEGGQEWIEAFKRFLKKQNPWPEKSGVMVRKTSPGLFEVVKTVKQPELAEFRPADKFIVTQKENRESANTIIGYIDSSLPALLNNVGVEPGRKSQILTIRRTLGEATFGQMLAELPKKAKVSFGRVFQMVEKQGRGQEGDLLVDGRANFFLIEGTGLVLDCCWVPDYRFWLFYVYPTSDLRRWGAGLQFLS